MEFWTLGEEAFHRNPVEYYRVLHEAYDDTPHWTAKAYRHLVNMPFRGFAPFNYDEQLPSEFRVRNPDPGCFSVYPPRNGQRYAMPQEFLSLPQRLICPHGYCDPANHGWEKQLILKESDYNQHYVDFPSPLYYWWVEMLLSIPCIF